MSDQEHTTRHQEQLISEADNAAYRLQNSIDALGDALDDLQRFHDHERARELFRQLEDDFVGPIDELGYEVSQLEAHEADQ